MTMKPRKLSLRRETLHRVSAAGVVTFDSICMCPTLISDVRKGCVRTTDTLQPPLCYVK